jgi:hypothetical protein
MEAGPFGTKIGENQSALERSERLTYLADMLSEMQDIATREGCSTLAGLLSLSHAEAQRQISGAKKQF